jgi:hypothetical protein
MQTSIGPSSYLNGRITLPTTLLAMAQMPLSRVLVLTYLGALWPGLACLRSLRSQHSRDRIMAYSPFQAPTERLGDDSGEVIT